MAEYDKEKVKAILQDYEETLEVLTINSKPLINDLTMAAGRYKPLAPQIVAVIESRLFEVAAVFSPFVSRVFCLCVSVYYCMPILSVLFVLCVCAGSREMAMKEGTPRITNRACLRFTAAILTPSHTRLSSPFVPPMNQNVEKRI